MKFIEFENRDFGENLYKSTICKSLWDETNYCLNNDNSFINPMK